MSKTILAAALLVLTASMVMASAPPVVLFSENFNSYNEGTRLRLAAPSWGSYVKDGTTYGGPENYIYSDQSWDPGTGYKAVRLKGTSGAGTNSHAETKKNLASQTTGQLVQLHFRIMADDYPNYVSDHAFVSIIDVNGHVVAGWTGSCYRMKTKYSDGGGEGIQWSFPDALWHDFDISYDSVTGETKWYADSALIWTQIRPAGVAIDDVYVSDTSRGTENWMWLDDVQIGLVPEPGSLMILGAGLAGLLAYRRKR